MNTRIIFFFGLLFSVVGNSVAQSTTKGEALDYLKSTMLFGMDTSIWKYIQTFQK